MTQPHIVPTGTDAVNLHKEQGLAGRSRELTRHIDPITVTIADAARISGLSRSSLYRLIQDAHIEKCKVGRRSLIRMDSLRAFLNGLPPAN